MAVWHVAQPPFCISASNCVPCGFGVAVRAGLLRDRERGARTRAWMTAATRRRAMLAVERELRRRVLGGAEQRRREARERVALCAVASAARRELALVLVGVTGSARAKREVAIALRHRARCLVALGARRGACLPVERIAGLRVVRRGRRLGQPHPANRRVTVLAVACRTSRGGPVRGTRRRCCLSSAACRCRGRDTPCRQPSRGRRERQLGWSCASHPRLLASCSCRGRPCTACGLNWPRMWICVARLARRELERLPLRRRRRVALLARDGRVLAGQRKSRELVIERALLEALPLLHQWHRWQSAANFPACGSL